MTSHLDGSLQLSVLTLAGPTLAQPTSLAVVAASIQRSLLALAWLLAQKPWIVPIPGTRNLNHLDENVQAIHVQLRPADLGEIGSALSKMTVHGGRMNREQMEVVD
jgi:aryl-alcohol dehydrogenase-like predicted oxidoreductase